MSFIFVYRTADIAALFRSLDSPDTAIFGKVYRTISQSKGRRLVFKTGVIMYNQNDTYIKYSKIFLNIYVFTYIYICYKIKT